MKLNVLLNDAKVKASNKLEDTKKDLIFQIKSWKKELGREKKYNVKIEKKLQATIEMNIAEKNCVCKETFNRYDIESALDVNPSEDEIVCTICARLQTLMMKL